MPILAWPAGRPGRGSVLGQRPRTTADAKALAIVEHGLGLNITVMSYAGALGFGFTTARCAVPDAHLLSTARLEALEELVARSRIASSGKMIGRHNAAAKSNPA